MLFKHKKVPKYALLNFFFSLILVSKKYWTRLRPLLKKTNLHLLHDPNEKRISFLHSCLQSIWNRLTVAVVSLPSKWKTSCCSGYAGTMWCCCCRISRFWPAGRWWELFATSMGIVFWISVKVGSISPSELRKSIVALVLINTKPSLQRAIVASAKGKLEDAYAGMRGFLRWVSAHNYAASITSRCTSCLEHHLRRFAWAHATTVCTQFAYKGHYSQEVWLLSSSNELDECRVLSIVSRSEIWSTRWLPSENINVHQVLTRVQQFKYNEPSKRSKHDNYSPTPFRQLCALKDDKHDRCRCRATNTSSAPYKATKILHGWALCVDYWCKVFNLIRLPNLPQQW